MHRPHHSTVVQFRIGGVERRACLLIAGRVSPTGSNQIRSEYKAIAKQIPFHQ